MSRLLVTIAASLILLPWQTSLPVEAGLQQAIRLEIESLSVSGHLSVNGIPVAAADLMVKVYERRGFAPVWDAPEQVESLLETVRRSYDDGLRPADYQLSDIEKLQQSIVSGRELSTREKAAFDLMLTDSLIRLVYHLYYGKVDAETRAAIWDFGRLLNGRDPSTVIAGIIDSAVLADAISSITTSDPDYDRLKAQLQQHRTTAAAGGWPDVPNGPTIRPDSNDPRIETLATRLSISGDLDKDASFAAVSSYTPALQDAVRRFQVRHGLEGDGLVGQATLRALNVSIEQRIDQIRVNLERARWRLASQVDDLILVNVAGFKAYVIRDGKIVWTMKIIVGEPDKQTPLFRATLSHIVLNPTWTVPYSIASEELLPKIKADPNFLQNGRYQLFDRDGSVIDSSAVDWSMIRIGTFPFTLVQQPGPANQLGQIKFVFRNDYSVCMHDTPARLLFTKVGRAFSHGCIRVDEPIDLAEVLLASEGWTRTEIEAGIESEETRTIVLANPLPIAIVYWTAEVNDRGEMYFFDDIYER
ncbi:MAG: L,D-transpeptidase family protein, partial [Gammaproteobacteria bacterium]|nr:L,D-transpeptidase family protein [Gammaproteobacteria bacterium]